MKEQFNPAFMGKTKNRPSSLPESVCQFCLTDKNDPIQLGKLITIDGFTTHYFCMLLASGLSQNGTSESEGILGFRHEDIKAEIERSKRLTCTFCHQKGAAIGCCKSGCRKAFHLPCGQANGTLHQFYDTFSSFCVEHRPLQKLPPGQRSSAYAQCPICLTRLVARPSSHTLHAPCCHNGWFHRECIQHAALSAGIHFFRCPMCNSKSLFQQRVLKLGIYIPDQDAAWELEPGAFSELLERPSTCAQADCKCPQGQKHSTLRGPWEVVLCNHCGSCGSHVQCAGLTSGDDQWLCPECFLVESTADPDDGPYRNLRSLSRRSKVK